jgi:predicted rRNA methylase YqxC with S4 and FtsJ domains
MKTRLDRLLVERGLAESREKAQALIMAGEVLLDGQKAAKPGQPVAADAVLEVLARPPYVSRGGRKLAGALQRFPIDLAGKICLDIGSSTGGFTDAMLQAGAAVPLLQPPGQMVILIKPQFEVGKGQVGKGGIVRDPQLHQAACERVTGAVRNLGFETSIMDSPIFGAEGNKEFLLYAHH